MVLFYVIWIAIGALIGGLINAALKGGKLALVGRAVTCAAGSVAAGFVLPFFGFEPGGPYLGAAVNAVIGGFVTLPVLWFAANNT